MSQEFPRLLAQLQAHVQLVHTALDELLCIDVSKIGGYTEYEMMLVSAVLGSAETVQAALTQTEKLIDAAPGKNAERERLMYKTDMRIIDLGEDDDSAETISAPENPKP